MELLVVDQQRKPIEPVAAIDTSDRLNYGSETRDAIEIQ